MGEPGVLCGCRGRLGGFGAGYGVLASRLKVRWQWLERVPRRPFFVLGAA